MGKPLYGRIRLIKTTQDKYMATYHLRKNVGGKYYWVLQSNKNYEIVAMSSEAYDSKQGALNSIGWTKANAEKAGFKDDTRP